MPDGNRELKRALAKIVKPNVYDELIKQITPTVIPTRFIQYVTVHYNDGKVVELSGTDITDPVPVKNYMSKEERKDTRSKMADVRVFIDTETLADEIDDSIDDLFDEFGLL